MNYTVIREDELYHHGILGQKWGVRRYQNEDGSLTDAGRKRYYGGEVTGGSKKLDLRAYNAAKTKAYTPSQKRHREKMFKKYEALAYKEEESAYKRGDIDDAKKIAAGRTYMRILLDSNYMSMAITSAANTAAAHTGKNYINEVFNYKFTRNDKRGGVDVTVDGHMINVTDSNHLYEHEEKESKRKTTVHTNKKAARRSESARESDQRTEDVLKKYNVSKKDRELAKKKAATLTAAKNRKDKETVKKLIKEYSKDYDIFEIPSEERYELIPRLELKEKENKR